MMNKNGISIFRVLLICLLFSFIIWVFVLTFQEIKKKNQQNDIVFNENLRFLDNDSTYEPLDDVYSFSYFGYNESNIVSPGTSSLNNPLDYANNSLVYFLNINADAQLVYVNNTSNSYPITSSPKVYNSNRLSISASLYSDDYFSRSEILNASGLGSSKSFIIAYNCNISISNFNFTMYYNFPISTSRNIAFWVLTDNGYYRAIGLFAFSSSVHTFTFNSDNIIASLPSATKVLRFGFAFAQSGNSTNRLNYLPQYDNSISSPNLTGINYYNSSTYKNYYDSFNDITEAYNLCYLVFQNSYYSNQFVDGYNSGYNDGINYMQGQITNLSQQINNLNSNITSLNNTINNQQQIITNLQSQINQSENNFKDLFFTFADIPIKTIHNILNFDFFGMNLFKFFTGVLTALGCIWLIKKFI